MTATMSKPAAPRSIPEPVPRRSRAVLRRVEAGCLARCAHCDEQIKFQAKTPLYQVICNVYVRKRWNRVEHYHEACYEQAGRPYGACRG